MLDVLHRLACFNSVPRWLHCLEGGGSYRIFGAQGLGGRCRPIKASLQGYNSVLLPSFYLLSNPPRYERAMLQVSAATGQASHHISPP